MAFEVTATRRRPKSFDELAGQEFVSSTLKSSLEAEQIAHAYLFSGPRGCGKTSAARILARSLNCGGAEKPCGVCPSCLEIARGASLDLIEIDGASNTGVNDVRQIKDEVLFPPQSSRYKIYIIDEVHMLTNNAFNALLKTIEEPPPYVVFIFATTELHKVPATIKSRCQQFAFKLIPIETISKILKDTCAEMGIAAEDEALFWIARESTGSLRDAYTLFDQVASFSEGNIRTALIREKLGLAGLENLNALAEACAGEDLSAAFALLDKIIDSGVAIEQLTIDLASYYRGILLLKCGVTRESLLGYPASRFSEKVVASLDAPRVEEALRILLALYRDIRYSISPRFEIESAVARLSSLTKWVSPEVLSAALLEAKAALGGGVCCAASNCVRCVCRARWEQCACLRCGRGRSAKSERAS
jgi:DNA polymerase-3 subunit gamma/tau